MAQKGPKVALGRYEIVGDLAAGGMAEILLARLTGPSGFERLVVIKRIFPHLAKDPAFVSMFLDEARTVARIRHPNVVQVHELAQDGADLFLAMEYLEGETVGGLLRRLWTKETRLDPMLAAHIVAETCRGLQAAHDLTDDDGTPLGLVHRDVSPQNLFITYDGAVKVLDFGIAKLDNRSTKTEPGHIKGKYAYMSPEQCAGKNLDRRSDVFSLGIVLHELCTGHRLFSRGSEMETLRALCESPILPPSHVAPATPPALDAICMRALSRRRDERYDSCAEMRRELLAAMREGDSGRDLEASLAELMQSLYADRIEEKREVLRRARMGQEIGVAPVAEADATVELPVAEAATVSVVTRPDAPAAPPVETPRAPSPAPPPRARSAWLVAAIAVLIASVTVAVVVQRPSPAPANAQPSAPLAASTPSASTPPAPASTPAPPSSSATSASSIAPPTSTPASPGRVTAPRRPPPPAPPSKPEPPPASTPAKRPELL